MDPFGAVKFRLGERPHGPGSGPDFFLRGYVKFQFTAHRRLSQYTCILGELSCIYFPKEPVICLGVTSHEERNERTAQRWRREAFSLCASSVVEDNPGASLAFRTVRILPESPT